MWLKTNTYATNNKLSGTDGTDIQNPYKNNIQYFDHSLTYIYLSKSIIALWNNLDTFCLNVFCNSTKHNNTTYNKMQWHTTVNLPTKFEQFNVRVIKTLLQFTCHEVFIQINRLNKIVFSKTFWKTINHGKAILSSKQFQ